MRPGLAPCLSRTGHELYEINNNEKATLLHVITSDEG